MIEFTCPACGKKHKAKDKAAGKSGKCSCGNRIKVPIPRKKDEEPSLNLDIGDDLSLKDEEEDLLALKDDDLAVQDDDDKPEPDSQDQPPQEDTDAGPGAEPGIRTLTYVLMGAAGAAFLVLAYYTVFCIKAYMAFKQSSQAIETHNKANAALGKNDREAYEAFVKCEEFKPEWLECYLRAAILSVKVDKPKIKQRFEEFITRTDSKKDKAWAYCTLGYLALRKKKPNKVKAREYLKKALKADKSQATPAVVLAALSFNEGLYSEARRQLKTLSASQVKKLPRKAASIYWRIKVFLANRDKKIDRFLHNLQQTKTNDPEFRRQTTFMAYNFLMKKGKIDLQQKQDAALWRVAKKITEFIQDDKQRKTIANSLCAAFYNAGNDEKAVSFIDQVIDDKSPPSPLMYALTGSLTRLSQKYQAGRFAAKAETATPKDGKKSKKSAPAKKKKKQKPAKPKQKPASGKEPAKPARIDYAAKAMDLYRRMVRDTAFLKKHGAGLLLLALGFADHIGDRKAADEFLAIGMKQFPDQAKLQRRTGFLLLKDGKFLEGVAHLEKALKLDPTQTDLKKEIALYRKNPVVDQFRPAKPKEYVTRPLIHVRVRSGTPMPLVRQSIQMLLDGKKVDFKTGGCELFFVPQEELGGGMHVLEVRARDTLGNKTEQKFKFPVDLTPPYAKLLRPRSGMSARSQPQIVIALLDEYTEVAPHSVNVILKNAAGNPYFCNARIIQNGTWKIKDEKQGIKQGDILENARKIIFHPQKELKSGDYQLLIQMKDIMEQRGKATLEFSIQ